MSSLYRALLRVRVDCLYWPLRKRPNQQWIADKLLTRARHDPDQQPLNLDVWLYARHRGDAHQGHGNVGEAPDRKEGGSLMGRIGFLTQFAVVSMCNCSKMKQGCVSSSPFRGNFAPFGMDGMPRFAHTLFWHIPIPFLPISYPPHHFC